MNTFKALVSGAAGVLSNFYCAAACSAVLYDNLSATSQGSESAGYIYGTGPLYDSFSTGATSVDSADVTLDLAGNQKDGGLWGASLLADNSGAPGSAIYSWNYLPDAMLGGTVTLRASIHLSPFTRYWVVVAGLDNLLPVEDQWYYSNDISGVGVSGEYWGDSLGKFSNNSGHGPFQMAISTPEPSTWAMMLLGFGVLGVASRRRKAPRRVSAPV